MNTDHLLSFCRGHHLSIAGSRFQRKEIHSFSWISKDAASYTVPIPKINSHCRQLTLDDFRGISISPVISKLFELAILERFSSLFEMSDSQFGFKCNLSCSHVIYNVRNVIENCTSHGSTVNVCSIDLSKAFDQMNHYALYIKLMKRGFPVALLVLLEKWFEMSVRCTVVWT